MPIPWSAAEHAVIRRCVEQKMPRLHILMLFPHRPRSAVFAKLARMFPRYVGRVLREPEAIPDPAETGDSVEALNRENDLRFQAAMLKAIKQGKEKASIGIVKAQENGEFRPRTFLPGLQSSGCSSSAALCADIGDRKGAIW